MRQLHANVRRKILRVKKRSTWVRRGVVISFGKIRKKKKKGFRGERRITEKSI